MACKGCSSRARRAITALGFWVKELGPNRLACAHYENAFVSLAIPTYVVTNHHTRATILALVTRILFGRSRTQDGPIEVEVWRSPNALSADEIQHYLRNGFRPGERIHIVNNSRGAEIRRAKWFPILGPVSEKEVEVIA